ncbi:hypothetical protein CR194_05735 [Salipaludibacillus keqinensis]|uniref:Uncharacterized protein n=1 Tax=Salipaludibacillus keqinensis TaxID=2045207 RepID=A0A323TLN5_9BACI|nr:hypothetical protein CR194_05735 [Salipaludibacillus keqinensis]
MKSVVYLTGSTYYYDDNVSIVRIVRILQVNSTIITYRKLHNLENINFLFPICAVYKWLQRLENQKK